MPRFTNQKDIHDSQAGWCGMPLLFLLSLTWRAVQKYVPHSKDPLRLPNCPLPFNMPSHFYIYSLMHYSLQCSEAGMIHPTLTDKGEAQRRLSYLPIVHGLSVVESGSESRLENLKPVLFSSRCMPGCGCYCRNPYPSCVWWSFPILKFRLMQKKINHGESGKYIKGWER